MYILAHLKPKIPTDGLIFYAPLNGINTTTAETGQELLDSKNVIYTTYQNVPCAYFNQAYINYNYSDDFPKNQEPSTMCIWMNYNTKQYNWPRMFSYGTNGSGRNRVIAFLQDTHRFCSFSNDRNDYMGTEDVPQNKWNFVLITCDGYYFKLYLDGKFIDTSPRFNIYTELNIINIGSANSGGNVFNGYLSSARIYNRILTDKEIKILSQEFVN